MKYCQDCGEKFRTKGIFCETCVPINPWSGHGAHAPARAKRKLSASDAPDRLYLPTSEDMRQMNRENEGEGSWRKVKWIDHNKTEV